MIARGEVAALVREIECAVAIEALSGSVDERVKLDAVHRALRALDRFARATMRLRAHDGARSLRAESALLSAAAALEARSVGDVPHAGWRAWLAELRRTWLGALHVLSLSVAFFAVSGVLGYLFTATTPEIAYLVLPHDQIDRILAGREWISSLTELPAVSMVVILYNNLQVALACFLGGCLFGFGGLFVLAYNAIFAAVTLRFAAFYDLHDTMMRFVGPHAPLEISLFVSAGVASVMLGQAFLHIHTDGFAAELVRRGRNGVRIMVGTLPWFVVAAVVEVAVSARGSLGFVGGWIFGVVLAATYWLTVLWPTEKGEV